MSGEAERSRARPEDSNFRRFGFRRATTTRVLTRVSGFANMAHATTRGEKADDPRRLPFPRGNGRKVRENPDASLVARMMRSSCKCGYFKCSAARLKIVVSPVRILVSPSAASPVTTDFSSSGGQASNRPIWSGRFDETPNRASPRAIRTGATAVDTPRMRAPYPNAVGDQNVSDNGGDQVQGAQCCREAEERLEHGDLHSGKSPRFAVVAPIADRFRLPSTLAAAPRSARPSAATAGRAPRAPPRGISVIAPSRSPPDAPTADDSSSLASRAARRSRSRSSPSSPFTSAPLSTPSESPAGRPRSSRRLFALPFAPAPAAPVREPILR